MCVCVCVQIHRICIRSIAPARCRACTSSASIPRTSATSNDTSTKCDLE